MGYTARRSALSAAGLMLIAGCSGGGHSAGSLPSSGGGVSGPSSLANGAKVTLSIAVPPRTTQSRRRTINTKLRPTSNGKRQPNFISPSTSSIWINAQNASGSFGTNVTLSQCTTAYALYQCAVDLPVGAYTLYTNLYDSTGNLLSTNVYASPVAQTIYANGSAYGNYVYVSTQGVAQYVFIATPNLCSTTTGSSAYAPIFMFDADDNEIVGALANPLTGYVNAVNGAGQGAADIYVAYDSQTFSADHQAIYDTSLYQPFIYESGPEGAVELYGATYNMPAYFGAGDNGAAGFQAGSIASFAYAPITVGTYISVAMTPGSPTLNAYDIEESVPSIQNCTSFSTYPSLSSPSYLGTVGDSSGNGREIIIVDGQNIDMLGTGNPVFYFAGGVPQIAFPITSTYTLGNNEMPINLFTSPVTRGRFFVITNNSNNSGNGQADQFLATNGSSVYSGTYSFQFAATSSLRIAGEDGGGEYGLYYTNPSGSNWLYGVDRTTGAQYAPLQMWASGEIYTISPAGTGVNDIFFRGYNNTALQYQLCTFDPTVGLGSEHCVQVGSTGAGDPNPVSMRLDDFSHYIMIVVGPTIQGGIGDVTPGSFSFELLYSSFPTSYARFIPGEATPGFVGVYDGSSTTTFLQWNGSSWISEGSVSWPNAWLASLY